jgi:formate dehydrogenase iron-sulfur subunit
VSTDRRSFLRLAGLAGVAAATGTRSADAASVRRISDDWLGMLTDLTLCVGCRKCEWACKSANNLPGREASIEDVKDTSFFKEERRTDAANFTVVNRFPPAVPGGPPVDVKKQCMHCNEPACASACLVAAFRKTPEGPVLYNEDVCIGCRYCMIACPFRIPAYEYNNPFSPAVRKCTMCFDRFTQAGKRPACAEMCPQGAITFDKRSNLIELARERIRATPGKYVDRIYGEYEAGGTSWLYISPKPFEQLGFPELDATPRPALTKAFLSAVPLVLTIWPALLMGAYAFTKRREELARDGEASHSEKGA